MQMDVEGAFINLFARGSELIQPYVAHLDGLVSHAAHAYLPAEILRETSFWYNTSASAHSRKLPLMNPVHVAVIIAAYLSLVGGGMLVMSRFSRFNLTAVAFFHNLMMVSLSAYMCFGILRQAVLSNYRVFGNPMDSSEAGWPMARLVWLFYVSKIFEFVDTIIMVLKKNNRQVSFLHLYHHTSIFAIWWMITYVAPGGEAYFSAALNSFIHVVMYGYYLLASVGVKQVMFIKPFITSMQMTQFACMLIQASYLLLHPSPYPKDLPAGSAPYPPIIAHLLFWYMISMLGLFGSFFAKTYVQKKKVE